MAVIVVIKAIGCRHLTLYPPPTPPQLRFQQNGTARDLPRSESNLQVNIICICQEKYESHIRDATISLLNISQNS